LTRILVADDLKDVTESMGLLFQTLGHDTKVADNRQQAVEAAAAFEPEIVFMDLDVPVMNGYDAARADDPAALPGGAHRLARRGGGGGHTGLRLRLLPAPAHR
jgi:DNA-binding LytR/AlgR family response regulator